MSRRSGQHPTARRVVRDWHPWVFSVVLLLATLAAYHPAWHGGLVWDDQAHVTRPVLQSWSGLSRIWFDVRATLQYYPLLHTAFWIEHRLWGDATVWYHLINIVEHTGVALLLLLILRRLAIPGAYLAAAVFALHPVHVESVAWISEQKNTLSTLFYLGAALAYLRFDESRRAKWYAAASALFACALLSKTVTATLPGALLVVFWWRRGRLSWKRDGLPVVPLFVVGAAAATITAWWELEINNCVGPDFQFTFVDRLLIAGRAVLFHLGKLLWPSDLAFIYPRWTIDAHAWWQYLFPLATVALAAGLWAIRRRSRAPLAAFLFFCGTLFPVAGFFNLYTFRYSFVANHYQYLASAGIIVLLAASVAAAAKRWSGRFTAATPAAAVIVAVPLAVLTWTGSGQYQDAESLYRATLRLNPACWLAHNNLALLEIDRAPATALGHLHEALRIKPDAPEVHNNLGSALHDLGRDREAIAQYEEALRLKPAYAHARNNLGTALLSVRKVSDAVVQYNEALRLEPDYVEARVNLGNAMLELGRVEEARADYEQALRLDPSFAAARYHLGNVQQRIGRPDLAVEDYEQAVRIDPRFAEARDNLCVTLQRLGRLPDAETACREALRLRPDSPQAHNNLGNVLEAEGRLADSIAQYQEALRLKGDYAEAHANLGSALLDAGRLGEALAEQDRAIQLAPGFADAHYNRASILRQLGRLEESVAEYGETLRLQPDSPDAHAALAGVLEGLGRPAAAAEQYGAAVALAPRWAEAQNRLGVVLERLGRFDEAAVHYQEAARLGLADAAVSAARVAAHRTR